MGSGPSWRYNTHIQYLFILYINTVHTTSYQMEYDVMCEVSTICHLGILSFWCQTCVNPIYKLMKSMKNPPVCFSPLPGACKAPQEDEEAEDVPTAPSPSPPFLPNNSAFQMPSTPPTPGTPGTPVTPSAPSPVEGPGTSECVVCMETGVRKTLCYNNQLNICSCCFMNVVPGLYTSSMASMIYNTAISKALSWSCFVCKKQIKSQLHRWQQQQTDSTNIA